MTQITDHFPQFLIIKQAGLSYKNCSYFKHDFSKLNEENLVNDFASLDQSYMNDSNSDINTKFNRFLSSLDELIKNHAPLKKLSERDVKFRNKPWINVRIQKMMRIRDKILIKLKRNESQSVLELNKKFRNRVTESFREIKANYFYNYFQKNSNNMKQLWSGIKSVISIRKSSNINEINKLKDSNGNIKSYPVVIAKYSKYSKIFDKYFVTVSCDITKNIPRSNKSPINFMKDRVHNSFFTASSFPVETHGIISLLRSGLSKKLARTCGMFFKVGHFLPINILIGLFNSLFSPFLQNDILVWGLTYETYINPVFLLQKRVIKAISFQNFASPSTPIFSDLKILKLYDLFQLKLLCFFMIVSIKFLPPVFIPSLN